MAKECLEGILQCYLTDGDPIPAQESTDKSGLESIAIDEKLAFALWLREQRRLCGLSQSDLAEAANRCQELSTSGEPQTL